MKRLFLLFVFFILYTCITVRAQQVLASFENFPAEKLILNEQSFNKALFVKVPQVLQNPDKTGINSSPYCLGAINIAHADWLNNSIELILKEPVKINNNNRFLSFLVYRSIQPKEMRVGFNHFEESAQIYFDRLPTDARWERITIDLATHHSNDTLKSIWIILSCNWSTPRSGWSEAAYYFDNFSLSSYRRLPNANVLIDASEVYQTIEDFGASDCWTTDVVGKYWDDEQKEFIAEKLFSKEFDAKGNPKGIGLSNWRINLGAGTAQQGENSHLEATRRSECFLLPNGNYDWTKQAGQQYFMQKAKSYGCENFLFFSNSAPIYFTKNGKGFANTGESTSNLQSDKFDDFAEFMATTTEHFQTLGYHIKYISPVNEPQYDWTNGQEGSPWQNADIKKLVEELDKSLQSRDSKTKIMIPEAGSWDKLYGGIGRASNQIYNFFDPASVNYIGHLPSVARLVAGHSYWTFGTNTTLKNTRSEVWKAANKYGLKTYQTEWSLLDAAPGTDTGFPESYDAATYMDLALFMGKLMYCDLAFANASSWAYWTSLSVEVYNQKSRFFLLRLTPSNGTGGYDPYASLFNGGKVETTPNLWVLGNYSLFIRPGYKRIRLDGAAEMNQLLGTAYIAPDSSRIVTVYVNHSPLIRYIDVDFKGIEGQLVTIKKYSTTASHQLAKDQNLSEAYSKKTIAVYPISVTTIVYDINKSPIFDGLNKIEKEPKISVSPNPAVANERVTVTIPQTKNYPQKTVLEVHSTRGELIYKRNYEYSNSLSFTLPKTVKKGLYILRVKNEIKTFSHKLMVK